MTDWFWTLSAYTDKIVFTFSVSFILPQYSHQTSISCQVKGSLWSFRSYGGMFFRVGHCFVWLCAHIWGLTIPLTALDSFQFSSISNGLRRFIWTFSKGIVPGEFSISQRWCRIYVYDKLPACMSCYSISCCVNVMSHNDMTQYVIQ